LLKLSSSPSGKGNLLNKQQYCKSFYLWSERAIERIAWEIDFLKKVKSFSHFGRADARKFEKWIMSFLATAKLH